MELSEGTLDQVCEDSREARTTPDTRFSLLPFNWDPAGANEGDSASTSPSEKAHCIIY